MAEPQNQFHIMQEDILETAKKYGHEHLVQHYNSLKDKDKAQKFLLQLKTVDFELANQLFKEVYLNAKKNKGEEKAVQFSPLEHVSTRTDILKNQAQLNAIGYQSISKGQAGICIMSGGQGTRLGFDKPKGMFNIKLQSNYTLFQYFARRLLRLNELVKELYPNSKFGVNNMIKWYMLTSDLNNEEIKSYFKANDYFGYDPDSVVFFPQGGFPALDYDGKIIIEDEGLLSFAPVGNGALYGQMNKQGVIKHMKDHGVKYVYIGPVDNVLLKVADPTCLGYMVKNDFQIVSTYVKKVDPSEKTGIHIKSNGKVQVCEYTQVPKELMEQKDANGDLVYCCGNRATLFMSTEFLDKISNDPEVIAKVQKKYHLAQKKIKIYNPQTKTSQKPQANNGVKFEIFYFDVFEQATRFGLFETLREEEFAPVKNAEGNDSPATARQLLWNLHKRWVSDTGINFIGEGPFEIDPRLCYNGENVKQILAKLVVEGKIQLPAYI